MRELVRHGDLHLVTQHGRIVPEVVDQGTAEQRDDGRQLSHGVVSQRRPVEECVDIAFARWRPLVDLHADARQVGREPSG